VLHSFKTMDFLASCIACIALGSLPCVYAAGIDPLKLPGVVVDDAEAEVTGNWTTSAKVGPYVGENYRFCAAGEKQKATFHARISESGSYHVLVAYTSSSNRAEAVPYQIYTANGIETVTINQRQKPSIGRAFEILGEYSFEAGDVDVIVDVEQASGGAVIIDAVQFLTSDELAEVKKNQPVDTPKLEIAATKPKDAKKAEEKKEPAPVEKPAPFVRQTLKKERQALTSAQLDSVLEKAIGGIENATACDDAAFLRRVTYDLIGRQPKPEELQAFLADQTSEKRATKVDQLLASAEFGSNWANYWSDVISYRTPQPELTFLNYAPFKAWLANEFNSGKKWDEMVYQIITAGGKVGENPAATFVGFHQADKSRLASETTRVFLSTQIQCAECHHHKFIDLKQETFHHVAAYFARVEAKLPWNDSQGIEVKSKDKGEHKMPGGKDDMTPGAFGEASADVGASDVQRRTELANWLVGPENPWFAKAFVNRVWGRTMGRGFSEPVDEIGELGDHVLPEVFTTIADHFVATEFDVKQLFRTITLSKAYQRPLAETPRGWSKPFAVLSPGRLRGDEVFDSLVQGLELPNVTPEAVKPSAEIRFPPPPKSTRDLVNEAFGVDPSLAAEHVTRTMQQVMFMMNNKQLQKQVNGTTESSTVLAKLLAESADDTVVLTQLYERLMARQPTEKELKIAHEHIASIKDRRAAMEDVLWGLLNSAEFVSRR
jgi:Protein of unknown function (DUF1549)/Protein of unknown function (DUF1553)